MLCTSEGALWGVFGKAAPVGSGGQAARTAVERGSEAKPRSSWCQFLHFKHCYDLLIHAHLQVPGNEEPPVSSYHRQQLSYNNKFRSPTQSSLADDEGSVSSGSFYNNMEPSRDLEISDDAPSYPGEDTRLTSSKELSGWYSYGWAAEVFVICGIGTFDLRCVLLRFCSPEELQVPSYQSPSSSWLEREERCSLTEASPVAERPTAVLSLHLQEMPLWSMRPLAQHPLMEKRASALSIFSGPISIPPALPCTPFQLASSYKL